MFIFRTLLVSKNFLFTRQVWLTPGQKRVKRACQILLSEKWSAGKIGPWLASGTLVFRWVHTIPVTDRGGSVCINYFCKLYNFPLTPAFLLGVWDFGVGVEEGT